MNKSWQFVVNSGAGRGQQTITVVSVTFLDAVRKVKYQLTNAELGSIVSVTQTIL